MFDERDNELSNNSNDTSNNDSFNTNHNEINDGNEGSEYRYSRSYYKKNDEEENGANYSSYPFPESTGFSNNSDNNKKKKKSGYGKKLAVVASLAIVGGSLAGASFEAVRYVSNSFTDGSSQVYSEDVANSGNDETEEANRTGNSAETLNGDSDTNAKATHLTTTVTDVSAVVESVMPSVVSITNLATTEIQVPDFFGYNRGGNVYEQEQESSGSGIIIDKNDTELLIVTNNHVVADATTLSVCFVDDSVVEAKIKGTDSDTDLAVIAVKLEDIPGETLNSIKIAELGDSDSLKVGEPAIAIGNALGYGQSVTTGVISAVNREVTVDNVANGLIQTDAAINPGNSGGALLNMKGQVIGINSVKYSSTEVEGMGYAIPISEAEPIIQELLTKETRDKVAEADTGYLGISGTTVAKDVAGTYNMPEGVYVGMVVEGGAAEAAGLKKGDIITNFDGNRISSMEDLSDILQYYSAGTTVTVKVQTADNGEYIEKELSVTLGRKLQ